MKRFPVADLVGVPPGLEDIYAIAEKEQRRHTAFRRLFAFVLNSYKLHNNNFGTVINLGCREGSDTDDIDSCFEEQKWAYKHIAIDCDSSHLSYAKEKHGNEPTIYIDDNAADPEIVRYYDEPVSLVLLRHPEIVRGNEDIWFDMVAHAWSRSHEHAQVLISVYNEPEYHLVANTFQNLPQSRVIESTINPHRDPELIQWSNRTDTWNCPDHYIVRLVKAA